MFKSSNYVYKEKTFRYIKINWKMVVVVNIYICIYTFTCYIKFLSLHNYLDV